MSKCWICGELPAEHEYYEGIARTCYPVAREKLAALKRHADALADAARMVNVWLGCEHTHLVIRPRRSYEWEELAMRCDDVRSALAAYRAAMGEES